MLPRILVDLSGQCPAIGQRPIAIVHMEREIARRLLDDTSLNTLAVVFRGYDMYALGRREAVDVLSDLPGGRASLHDSPAMPPEIASPTDFSSGVIVPPGLTAPHATLRRRALGILLRTATLGGRRVIAPAPALVRSGVRHSLVRARSRLLAMFRSARTQEHTLEVVAPIADAPRSASDAPPLSRAPVTWPVLSTIVHPVRTDILWTCDPFVKCVPLRRLAEAKLVTGFRLASLRYEMSGIHQTECSTDYLSTDVVAVRTIDQLDASDVVFCVSKVVQDDLHRLAAETGRPFPNSRLLPLSPQLAGNADFREVPTRTWDMVAAVVPAVLLALITSESER